MKKDKRNLGGTFIAGDIQVSDVTEEEARESQIKSFKEGLLYLEKKIKDESKRKNS